MLSDLSENILPDSTLLPHPEEPHTATIGCRVMIILRQIFWDIEYEPSHEQYPAVP